MLHHSALPSIPSVLEGCQIFPVVPNGKDPFPGTKGWYEASADAAQLAEWFRDRPGCNWAVATGLSGLFVIDVDPGGLAWWSALLAENESLRTVIGNTLQVRTPRGGLHVYFKGEGPSTASRIAEGIDTRGGLWRDGRLVSGGYVLLPGSSTVNGAYEVVNYAPIAPLSDEVRLLVPERPGGQVHGLDKDPEKDQPRNVSWAINLLEGYVESGRVSVQGKGGNNLAFQVAASVLDKAISPGTCYELLMEHWNPHCSPPWDDWELERVVRNAAAYGEDASAGAKGFQSNEAAFGKFAGQATSEEPQKVPERKHKVQWIEDYRNSVQDPTWLIPNFIPAQGTGVMYGNTGSYKSFLALDMAATLAHGIAGQWGAAPVQHDVLFLAGEMPVGTARLRYPAWQEWREVAGMPNRLAILPMVPYLHNKEGWDAIHLDMDQLGMRPSLIVIDTLSRLMTGMDENNAKEAVMAIDFMENLARYYECFVLAVHHEGKDATKGARGSSALISNPDMAINTKKKGNGTEVRIKKQKDVDVPESPFLFSVKPVGNSIVLEKTDALVEEPKSGGSKISWLEKDYIVSVLNSKGKCSTSIIAQDISLNTGAPYDTVVKKLRKAPHLEAYRSGDIWELPQLEYDL